MLEEPKRRQEYQEEIEEGFEKKEYNDIDEKWKVIKQAANLAAKNKIGVRKIEKKSRKQSEISELMERRSHEQNK